MTGKILVVEDSPTMRQLIGFALRPLKDYKVVEAVDGLDGLKKVQSDIFALAMIDINMPMMDGLKLISLIRQDEKNKAMPIVIVTTESNADIKQKASAMGVNSFITKPIMANFVLSTVKGLLGL